MNTSSPSFSPSPTPFTHRSLKVGKKISNLPEGSCFQYFLNPLLGASSGSPKTSGSASPLPPPLAQPHCSLCCSLITAAMLLPQGLCSGRFLCPPRCPSFRPESCPGKLWQHLCSSQIIPNDSGHTGTFRNWKWNYKESWSSLRVGRCVPPYWFLSCARSRASSGAGNTGSRGTSACPGQHPCPQYSSVLVLWLAIDQASNHE